MVVPYMYSLINLLSALMIVTASIISEERNIIRCARTYTIQTSLLIAIFLTLGVKYHWFLFWAISAAVTKAFLAPYLIIWVSRKTKTFEEEASVIPRMPSIALIIILIVISFALSINYVGRYYTIPLGVSLALTLLGLYILATKRNIIKQIFGFLHFENGAHLALAVLAPTIPETIDAGIASDAIILVLVLTILVRMLYKSLKTLDVSKLSILKYS